MEIKIQTIPHAAQRYPTIGDWYMKGEGRLRINVSDMGDSDFEFLVMVHELVESYMCNVHGVSPEEVDEWDKAYTKDGEPGDDPMAPYHKEHCFAEQIEKTIASELHVDWDDYMAFISEFMDQRKGAWVRE